jgi:hypothetical protein
MLDFRLLNRKSSYQKNYRVRKADKSTKKILNHSQFYGEWGKAYSA